MTRFIQQRIKPLVSRFIPKALCPSCGVSLSSEIRQKKEEKVVKVVKKKEKKKQTD